MLAYILKVFLIQLIGLGIYFAFLRNQKLFAYARKFLWTVIVSSFILPLISLPIFEKAQPSEVLNMLPQQIPVQEIAIAVAPQTYIGMHGVYWIVYGLIAITMLGRLFMAFWKLTNVKKRSRFQAPNLYFSREIEMPYSFLNGIFIPTDFQADDKLALIIAHENEHITRKHSWDKIIISTLVSVMWFNPLLRLFHKELEIVHEYQVDESVTAQFSLDDYLQSLLQSTIYLKRSPISLTHSFFSSPIKNRIIMLHKKATNTFMKRLMSIALLLCVVFSAVYLQGQTVVKGKAIHTAIPSVAKDTLFAQNMDGTFSMTIVSENGDSTLTILESQKVAQILNAASSKKSNVSFSFDEDNVLAFTIKNSDTHSYENGNLDVEKMMKLGDTLDLEILHTNNKQNVVLGGDNIFISTTEPSKDTLYDKKLKRKVWKANDANQYDTMYVEKPDGSIGMIITNRSDQASKNYKKEVRQEKDPNEKDTVYVEMPDGSLKMTIIDGLEMIESRKRLAKNIEAQFPGGKKALNNYIGKRLKLTKEERRSMPKGIINIALLIDKTGKVKKASAANRIPQGMDLLLEKSLEVMKNMPRWIPASYDGKKVEQTVIIPISIAPEESLNQK